MEHDEPMPKAETLEATPEAVQQWLGDRPEVLERVLRSAPPELLQQALARLEPRQPEHGLVRFDGSNGGGSGGSGGGSGGGRSPSPGPGNNVAGAVPPADAPPGPRPKRNSVTTELFQTWLEASPVKRAKSPNRSAGMLLQLQQLDERDRFMELVRDVANELDIDTLCYKILVNVRLLTHADRGSLFLARGSQDHRYLVAKLFTDDAEAALDRANNEELRIPFGPGSIAGLVAQTKEPINIPNAYEDPRFNSDVDKRTGYKTNHILAMPICNHDDKVIGVAQIINKTDGSDGFSREDERVFIEYLTFCGSCLQNAQIFEKSVQEFRRNKILLDLARSIFEEQNNLECLVTKIMRQASELLKCDRCAVFLMAVEDGGEEGHLDRICERPGRSVEERKPLCRRKSNNTNIKDVAQLSMDINVVFNTVFELRPGDEEAKVYQLSSRDQSPSRLLERTAAFVAARRQILNISDVSTWNQDAGLQEDEARSILCMPILNGQKTVIGVAQLIIEKGTRQPFTECDQDIFEAFTIFCGLGIHNTQMYENACKLMAKQKVALECLSYHATASDQDMEHLSGTPIPATAADTYGLYSFTFSDFELSDDDTCRATVCMFLQCKLVQKFQIPYQVLCRWVLSVKKNYRPVKYHNWRHAFTVAQTMFAILQTGKMAKFMSDLEILGLLVACLCHDLDHRGTNNAFQTKTESPLAILYSTSTMEHHHFDQCVMILNSEANNIFQGLSTDDYRAVMHTVEHAILSTDLAMYFSKRKEFNKLVDEGEIAWCGETEKDLLCGMMMTACDVSAIAKPWQVQHKTAKLVAEEFFDQGDLERTKLSTAPVAMMDRQRKDELPKMQLAFIDSICLPLYKTMADTFPWIQPLLQGCAANRDEWRKLAEQVEMGLTWIDHDTIEKPIEDFSNSTEPAPEDIQLTVTTFNRAAHAAEDGDGEGLPPRPVNGSDGRRGTSLRKPPSKAKQHRKARARLCALL